jgi:type I restriction enzyme S subunit
MAAKALLGGALDVFGDINLPEGWKFDLLGNRCTIRRGASPRPAGDPKYFGGGSIPWIKIGDATKIGGRYIESTDEYVNQEGAKRSVQIPPGSLVISNSGVSLGFAAITRIGGCIHDGWLYPTAFRDLDRDYLYYCVNLATRKLREFADGTTQPNLNTDIARRLLLPMPPLDEQRAIAHILGTLDDKIELNRRISETLEAMARALFKSWFVDFDPVRAKMEGRDPGLPKPLADLFPARLVDSELGEIPEGWAVAPMADHFEAVKGVSYKGVGLGDDGMPLHNLNSVYEGGGYKYEGIKYYSGEHADRHIVMPGDMIVANTEQGHDRLLIGYAAIVPKLFGPRGIASHHIYRLRPKPRSWLTSAFLCRLLNSPQMHELVSGYANGTTVNMLPIDGVQKPLIVCPPRRLVAAFTAFGVTAERRREEMISESRTLASLRDALLPKLITGEIRVKGGTNTVEAR